MDVRRLRALTLILSEYAHQASNTIIAQRDVIEKSKYTLEIIMKRGEESFELNIYQNISINGEQREVYGFGGIYPNDVTLAPFCTRQPFTKHDRFVKLTENMNISKLTYCIELRNNLDGMVFIYFRYDGDCFAIAYDSAGSVIMSINLDPIIAFQELKDMFEIHAFHIGQYLFENSMFLY
jgi:hypothetical protein